MRERDIEAYLVKRVKELGGEVRKAQWIGRHGAPDRLVMLPEKLVVYVEQDICGTLPAKSVWVELKSSGVKPEAHQIREHNRMRRLGQLVEVIDSIEGVDALLEGR